MTAVNGDYAAFLAAKSQMGARHGFRPLWMPSFLFDFQAALVEWAIEKGRAAIFADCGLGKTPMQLVWAENVARHTGGRVLILTPLAVAAQTVREGEKFGIEVRRERPVGAGIVAANYERLHHFDPADYAGVVCDESSILKSFDGVRRAAITAFMRTVPYRLLCTATAAPNDYTELGTSSEALGYLGHMDMLHRFFKMDDQAREWMGGAGRRHITGGGTWRLKGHAEEPFWRWVCSWARAIRRPSDLDCDDRAFVLPPLEEREHVVTARRLAAGHLFALPAHGLAEQREERRRTIAERCERVAALVSDTGAPALAWCHLNPEGDLLTRLIPGAVQVSGQDTDEEKEAKFLGFIDGSIRVVVTKPRIGAWGLNLQHCAHTVSFPSHSFEQYYQSVRRFWRFGQTRPVVMDLVTTEGERGVMANLQRKQAAADRMFDRLVVHMRQALHIDGGRAFLNPAEVPSWL